MKVAFVTGTGVIPELEVDGVEVPVGAEIGTEVEMDIGVEVAIKVETETEDVLSFAVGFEILV